MRLVSFKTKLVTFHHHQANPKPALILMSGLMLKEASCLKHLLLVLKLTIDLKCNTYICAITKDAGKMVSSLYHTRKSLMPIVKLYIYKSQIRSGMEYCCHIWVDDAQFSLSSFNRVQEHLHGLMVGELFSSLQSLSNRWNVASLTLFYHNDTISFT